jgi:hypothetical protein
MEDLTKGEATERSDKRREESGWKEGWKKERWVDYVLKTLIYANYYIIHKHTYIYI